MTGGISTRRATADDIPALNRVARVLGAVREDTYFQRCIAERHIFVAEIDGAITGYGQLNFSPLYRGFSVQDMPEIQDVCVLPEFRNRGCATAIITRCEAEAHTAGKTAVGISVGLTGDYGPAQRLYVRLGYVPDGAGITHEDVAVTRGGMYRADDALTLKMVKSLS